MGAWPNDRLWMATGNNLRIGGDIASRSVSIRLKPTAPHPEERTGFAIPDLQGWIMNPANRGRLLERLLILVADWVAAGTPKDTSVPAMRQFTPWAHGVGGFLAHHGITGFLGNLSAMRAMDEEDHKWAVFLATWLDKLGPRSVRPPTSSPAPMTASTSQRDHGTATSSPTTRAASPATRRSSASSSPGQADRFHGDPPLTLRTSPTATTRPGCTGWNGGKDENPRQIPAIPAAPYLACGNSRFQYPHRYPQDTRRYPQTAGIDTRNARRLAGI